MLRLKTCASFLVVLSLALTFGCQRKINGDSILKIEMNLSNFGVESASFPSIHASINLVADTSYCKKVYDDPKYKDSTYSLSKDEMRQIYNILKDTDLGKLKNKYAVTMPDQPTSTTTIYTKTGTIVIEDYGLQGEAPLQELYKIIYKF